MGGKGDSFPCSLELRQGLWLWSDTLMKRMQIKAGCQLGPACGSNMMQNSVVVFARGVPAQSSTDPGKPVQSLWQTPLSPSVGMAEHWGFGSPLTSYSSAPLGVQEPSHLPTALAPWNPTSACPRAALWITTSLLSSGFPSGHFKCSLINSSCADKSVLSTGWNLQQLTVVTALTQVLHPLGRQRWAWPLEHLHGSTLQCLGPHPKPVIVGLSGHPRCAFGSGQEALSWVVSYCLTSLGPSQAALCMQPSCWGSQQWSRLFHASWPLCPEMFPGTLDLLAEM